MRQPLDVRPIKTVLYWQLGLSCLAMLIFGGLWGVQGALSAAFGGIINVCANGAYALAMRLGGRPRTPGATLLRLFRAEAIKIGVIATLLVIVLVFYQGLQPTAFFVTFCLTVLAFSAALFSKSPESGG